MFTALFSKSTICGHLRLGHDVPGWPLFGTAWGGKWTKTKFKCGWKSFEAVRLPSWKLQQVHRHHSERSHMCKQTCTHMCECTVARHLHSLSTLCSDAEPLILLDFTYRASMADQRAPACSSSAWIIGVCLQTWPFPWVLGTLIQVFMTRSHSVTQAGLELVSLLRLLWQSLTSSGLCS